MRTVQILGITGTPAYLIGRRIEGGEKVEILYFPSRNIGPEIRSASSTPHVDARMAGAIRSGETTTPG